MIALMTFWFVFRRLDQEFSRSLEFAAKFLKYKLKPLETLKEHLLKKILLIHI